MVFDQLQQIKVHFYKFSVGCGHISVSYTHLGVDMGMFYKRRDYSNIIDGRNPIVAHEFLGADVKGKDMIIIDDMISSGESMLEVAKLLKAVSYTHLLHGRRRTARCGAPEKEENRF